MTTHMSNSFFEGSQSLYLSLNSSYPEYLSVVPDYWLLQKEPSKFVQYFVAVYFLVIGLINNVCFALIVIVVVRKSSLRTSSNYLLLSLLSSDFLLLVCGYVNVVNGFSKGPILGREGCYLYGFLGSTAAISEIWSLTAVAIDRWRAVCYPLQSNKRFSKRDIRVIIGAIWMASAGLALGPLLGWNSYVAEANLIGCSIDTFSKSASSRGYVIVLLIVAWVIPLTLIAYAYCTIFTNVKSSLTLWTKVPSAAEEQRRKVEISLAKMVSFLILLWLATWTPYAIISIWNLAFEGKGLSPLMATGPTLLCKTSATLNAFHYGVRLPKFSREIRILLKPFRSLFPHSAASCEREAAAGYEVTSERVGRRTMHRSLNPGNDATSPQAEPRISHIVVYEGNSNAQIIHTDAKAIAAGLEDTADQTCSCNDVSEACWRAEHVSQPVVNGYSIAASV